MALLTAWAHSLHFLPYFVRVLCVSAVTTVVLTASAFCVAFLLGFVIALMRLSRSVVLKAVANVYLELFRNVPLLTQLFVLYFGLERIGVTLPAFVAATLGFGLNGAAILSEVFRSSINGVDRGQREAALAIGMTWPMALATVVLPQSMRLALPALANFAIGLLKDTSLASAVAVPELVFRARMLVSETYQTNLIYFIVAIIYLLLSLALSRLSTATERGLGKPRAALS
ncbi:MULTISPECIES: amino acid ABC transporter permease [unclassified Caballeronia]|jgi:polar amino acid transport system permease protein/cystine transport system permease protein|uniref:amino acid ABC transporter permease n=1 Tax=unclassified Caballeronia TaxID=2646786 RepID=UPI001FD12BEF|nr:MULTISPECIES: amino acid ABC transporter permease [unclassified Caballeronia]MDR5774196.1 amino acid ABC transporter permease [Caballeronia sp. LZ002]MDR5849631.1 amino acid ABC transporter permease [Caballeronia sp. LZ003]